MDQDMTAQSQVAGITGPLAELIARCGPDAEFDYRHHLYDEDNPMWGWDCESQTLACWATEVMSCGYSQEGLRVMDHPLWGTILADEAGHPVLIHVDAVFEQDLQLMSQNLGRSPVRRA